MTFSVFTGNAVSDTTKQFTPIPINQFSRTFTNCSLWVG